MGIFFDHPPRRLVAGRSNGYRHFFGGSPAHRGVIPPDRDHPLHLLYELDLGDPDLGLASRFAGLTRLPLYNALGYNCCDLVYRPVADDEIEIIAMTNPDDPEWTPDNPFDDYPAEFERHPVVLEPVESEVIELLDGCPATESAGPNIYAASREVQKRLEALEYPFPQVGGRQMMLQSIPEWDCRSRGCGFAGEESDAGKEVLAVIWERPAPGLHLWNDVPKRQQIGSAQIILSRCTGCGALHSCNRCD